MRLAYGRPLALWLSSTSASARAFAPYHHRTPPKPFLPRLSAFRGGAQHQSYMTSTGADNQQESLDVLRVGLCQFQVTDDKAKNHATCSSYIERAAKDGAQLIVLPEIWASPYATAAFPEYAEELPDTGARDAIATKISMSPSAQVLQNAAMQHKVWLVGGSVAEKDGDQIFNTCLIFNPQGDLVAKHRKVHLFDIDVPGGITFFESDTLSAGSSVTDFDTPWCKIGLGICYDIRFAAYAMLLQQKGCKVLIFPGAFNMTTGPAALGTTATAMLLQQKGCKVLIFPGAFNMTTGPAHWELLQRGRAVDNQCFVLTASPARTEAPETPGKYPHYTAWGHSTAVSPWGDVIATTNEQEGIVMADLDLAQADQIRTSIPISNQQRTDLYKVDEA
eukprot:CAMPEP_0172471308 /NCGR_PEP_ID=MMETSP1065-20121228/67749_1 /TAXON_ID=265537 /ORGANISM="Amphiprora paludosa, Strain CCMP125" /LENGTH=390 /DNA_ID=CAMNT_0013229403 /DNA_START=224 /DNA_END=1395 /DNA_ORIENTATION=-